METMGERLRYARKSKGYTQNRLAGAIGVSRGVIYNIEKSITHPQAIVLNALCQVLGIHQTWLREGVGEMRNSAMAHQSARILSELYEVAKDLSEEEQRYLLDVIEEMKMRLAQKKG